MIKLTPEDRDYLVRTLIGEAGADASEGDHASMAHTILNRLKSDKYADTAKDVALHPGHFPSWGNNSRELLALNPEGKTYKRAAAVADRAISGDLPDTSGGSTEKPTVLAQAGDLGGIAGRYGVTVGDTPVTPPVASPAPRPDAVPADTAGRYGVDLGGGPTEGKMPQPPAVPPSPEAKKQAAKMGLATSMVEAMPIVGPTEQLVRAGISASQKPAKEGESYMDRLTRELNIQHQASNVFAEEHPIKATVGGLAGAAIGTGAMASTRLGARALGLSGETLGERAYQSGVGGGVMGVMDALSRGEDPLHGGVVGAGLGLAGPVAGEAGRGVGRFVSDRLWPTPGPLNKLNPIARSWLAGAMEGETPASIAAGKARAGEHGFLADISTGLTDLAGGIADLPGAGKVGVREPYRLRAERHGAMLGQSLNDAFGPPTDIRELTQFHKEARKAAADPLYRQFRDTEVTPSEELKKLVPRLEKAGAFDKAEELSGISGEPIDKAQFHGLWMHDPAGPPKYPTTQTWDYVKRGLDSQIDVAYRAGDNTKARELTKLKHELIDEIDKTSAGPIWRQARAEFADRSALIENIERGADTFLGSRSGIDKSDLKYELSKLSGPEFAARIQGVRAAIDQAMNDTVGGASSMRNKLLAPNNQEKIKLLLGKDEGERLIGRLKSLAFLAEQDANIRGNLATGASAPMRSARKEALQPGELPRYNPSLVEPLSLVPPHIREAFRPSTIIEGIRAPKYAAARASLAPILTQKAGPTMDDLLYSIQEEVKRQARASKYGATASKLFTAGITGPVSQTARSKLEKTEIPFIR